MFTIFFPQINEKILNCKENLPYMFGQMCEKEIIIIQNGDICFEKKHNMWASGTDRLESTDLHCYNEIL